METSLVIDHGTFRQLAMIAAMQGMLASPTTNPDASPQSIAKVAMAFADALLEANTIEAKSE